MISNNNTMWQELDKDTLSRLYLKENKSIRAIAKINGCSHSSVARRCRKYGIKLRSRAEHKKINIDKSLLQQYYVEERKSVEDIAGILSCNPTTVLRRLNEYKIPVRRNRREGLTKQLIQKLYLKDGKSTREIGKLLGCSRHPVQQRCRVFAIPLRNPRHTRIKIDEETLRRLYIKDGRSIEQIAKKVGCCDRTIIERLKRFGFYDVSKRRKLANGKQ